MTKADLIEQIHEQTGLSKSDAADMVEILFNVLKESLANDGTVKISGFGTFSVRNKRARKGRNPKTGEEMEISPRRVVTFSASESFKEQVNVPSVAAP